MDLQKLAPKQPSASVKPVINQGFNKVLASCIVLLCEEINLVLYKVCLTTHFSVLFNMSLVLNVEISLCNLVKFDLYPTETNELNELM